jgi:hypothetical protein
MPRIDVTTAENDVERRIVVAHQSRIKLPRAARKVSLTSHAETAYEQLKFMSELVSLGISPQIDRNDERSRRHRRENRREEHFVDRLSNGLSQS